LKRRVDEAERALEVVNTTLVRLQQEREDNGVFSREFTSQKFPPAKVTRPVGLKRCAVCESQLSTKNSSLVTLELQYSTQARELTNMTSLYHICDQERAVIREDLGVEVSKVQKLKEDVRMLEEKSIDQDEKHGQKVKTLRNVVRGMQKHLQCLQTEENCVDEASLYTSLPNDVMSEVCLLHDVTGQELFGLATCNLLGDRTLGALDWKIFRSENPQLTGIILSMVIFAIIGCSVTFFGFIWCGIRHRETVLYAYRGCRQCTLFLCVRKNQNHEDPGEHDMKEVETEKDVVESEKSKKSEVQIPVATDEVNKLWEGVSKKAGGHGVRGDRESKLLDTVINENVQGKN